MIYAVILSTRRWVHCHTIHYHNHTFSAVLTGPDVRNIFKFYLAVNYEERWQTPMTFSVDIQNPQCVTAIDWKVKTITYTAVKQEMVHVFRFERNSYEDKQLLILCWKTKKYRLSSLSSINIHQKIGIGVITVRRASRGTCNVTQSKNVTNGSGLDVGQYTLVRSTGTSTF